VIARGRLHVPVPMSPRFEKMAPQPDGHRMRPRGAPKYDRQDHRSSRVGRAGGWWRAGSLLRMICGAARRADYLARLLAHVQPFRGFSRPPPPPFDRSRLSFPWVADLRRCSSREERRIGRQPCSSPPRSIASHRGQHTPSTVVEDGTVILIGATTEPVLRADRGMFWSRAGPSCAPLEKTTIEPFCSARGAPRSWPALYR